MATIQVKGIDNTTGQKKFYSFENSLLGTSNNLVGSVKYIPNAYGRGCPIYASNPLINNTGSSAYFLSFASGTSEAYASGSGIKLFNDYFITSGSPTDGLLVQGNVGGKERSSTGLLPYKIDNKTSGLVTAQYYNVGVTDDITNKSFAVGVINLQLDKDNSSAFGWSPNPTFEIESSLLTLSSSASGWQEITNSSVTLNNVQTNSKFVIFYNSRITSTDAYKLRFLEGANDLTTTHFDDYTNIAPVTGDTNIKLLLQSETTDGDTTFTDSSSFARTITRNDNGNSLEHDTSTSKFGSSSILISPYDQTSSTYLSVADSADFTFTGDFTIDLWADVASFAGGGTGDRILFSTGTPATSGALSIVQENPSDRCYVHINGVTDAIAGSTDISIGGPWYHIALVRSGSTITLYINGTSEGTYSFAGTLDGGSLGILGGYASGLSSFHGNIEELRVVNGSAEWTTNFTPPTEPYASATPTSTSNWQHSYAYLTSILTAGNYTVKPQVDPLGNQLDMVDGSFYVMELLDGMANHFNATPATPTTSASDYISVGSLTVSEGSSLVVHYMTKGTGTLADTDNLQFFIKIGGNQVSKTYYHGTNTDGQPDVNSTLFVSSPLSAGTYTVALNGSRTTNWTHNASSFLIFEVRK
jgi:hypothetical protein